MNQAIAAWLVTLAGAVFAGFFEWTKVKSEYLKLFGVTPEKTFTEEQIDFQLSKYKTSRPNIYESIIKHNIRPLMFFVIFKSFLSASSLDITLKGLVVIWFISFFLYDDFVGKVAYSKSKIYLGVQAANWIAALWILGDYSILDFLCKG